MKPTSPVPPGPEPRVLKRSPFRTVLAREGDRVVKRFHHPGALGALRDSRRARREHEVLARLAEAGVRVPSPLGVLRTKDGVELTMARIEGARTLEERWAERASDPGRPALAREELASLGTLLAGLHRAGIDHPDLHPGNVLLDRAGHAWAVDFHAARPRRRLRARHALRDLVALAAHARELTRAPERARVLRAWCAAAPEELLRAARELGAVGLEARARRHRRERIEHWAGRWTRPSSRVSVERGPGDRRLLRARPPRAPRVGDERDAADALAAFHAQRTPGALVLELDASEARARWLLAVRLFEHHLPVPRPLSLVLEGGRGRLALDPAGATVHLAPGDEATRLGTLLGQLHDRGLEPERLAAADLVEGAGGWFWKPPVSLRAVDPLATGWPRWRALSAPSSEGAGRDELRRAYLAVWRDRPAERRRVGAADRGSERTAADRPGGAPSS